MSQLIAPRRFFVRVVPVVSIALALAAGAWLRLWMLKYFFQVDGDSLIYGGIAKNLLLHGQYALNFRDGGLYLTLIRLPGYPLFLALCFRVFGMENYASATWVQIVLDLFGCLLLADFAGRIVPAAFKKKAAHGALWLAVLCPFTAIYTAKPLGESLTLFAMALALWTAARFQQKPGWGWALCFTFAVSWTALLRPDGVLLGAALIPALAVELWLKKRSSEAKSRPDFAGRTDEARTLPRQYLNIREKAASAGAALVGQGRLRLVRMGVVCGLLAMLPFAAWSWRNWQIFHVFEPLAPRLATEPGEDTHLGWERWVKSWCLDFVSTYEIYWYVPDDRLDVSVLPSRAFDSPAQYVETATLAADYNQDYRLTRSIDARFERLAEERIRTHPLRYYVWLPLGRLADMTLRPRVENLYDDLDWWVYASHPFETRLSWAYVGLNAVYLLLGLAGLCLRPRFWLWMLAYIVLRGALLLTVQAPEARYTLEWFPMLFVLGGVAAAFGLRKVAGAGKRFARS